MNQGDKSAGAGWNRRSFLQASSLAAAAGTLPVARGAHAAGDDAIKIALVGCGGRGRGAVVQALNNAAGANVRLVALVDAFRDRVDDTYRMVSARHPDRVDVPEERKFTGLDGYERALECDVDLVQLCGPPGFRPAQFEAAVAAGKHVFMEKPVATDAPGVRRVMAANEVAKEKGLLVAVGHHLRHEVKHVESLARIHDGAIGRVEYVRAYFNSTGVWVRNRQPDQSEMEYQVRNWYYFTWLSGDHIVEQHVHDLDIGNWILQATPVQAQGSGGRQVRIGPEYGEIFDHHTVEFTYADGSRMFSYCRHIPNCWNSFSQHAHGTGGSVHIEGHGPAELRIADQEPIRIERGPAGHQRHQNHLFAALLEGQPFNEGDFGASATMTAILGRMATYSGQVVRWQDALNSQIDLSPSRMTWDAEMPVQPGPDGLYPCAIPGVTPAV